MGSGGEKMGEENTGGEKMAMQGVGPPPTGVATTLRDDDAMLLATLVMPKAVRPGPAAPVRAFLVTAGDASSRRLPRAPPTRRPEAL